MDIAKIRKKAREKEQGETTEKAPAAPPVGQEEIPEAGPTAPPAVGEAPAERKEEKKKEQKEEKREEVPHTPPLTGKTEEAPSEAVPAEQEKEEAAESGGDILELLTFRLSREEFAFQVSEVEEIVRHQSITRVPSLPDYVLGITSLRGKIIPVIDLKKRLALSDTAGDREEAVAESEGNGGGKKKILIIAGPKGLIGATIDKVIGVVRLARENLLEPPSHLTEEELKCIGGVVILDKRFISTIRAEDALNIEVG
jgi:purine-binding chemotaxis protein CheW